MKGSIVRSRTEWLTYGEKPTNFFCGLENKNYVNKTIKKIVNNNNESITNQKEILKTVKQYYDDLFSNKDHELQDVDMESLFENEHITKLTDKQKNSIEQPITIAEISKVINKMNNNKSPGSDGFPAEFYKIFWVKLKTFIHRAINDCYKTAILQTTARECIISCLPKGDKPREYLKNWRPISLLMYPIKSPQQYLQLDKNSKY